MFKKTTLSILALIILIAIIWVGSAWYIGKTTQTKLEQQTQQLSQSINSFLGPSLILGTSVKVELQDYQRNLFDSQARLVIGNAQDQSHSLIFNLNIQHGPVLLGNKGQHLNHSLFGRSFITLTLSPEADYKEVLDIFGKQPFLVESYQDYAGNMQTSAKFFSLAKAFTPDPTNPEQSTQWQGATLLTNNNADGTLTSLDFKVPKVEISSLDPQMPMVMEGMHLKVSNETSSKTYSYDFNIPKLGFELDDTYFFAADIQYEGSISYKDDTNFHFDLKDSAKNVNFHKNSTASPSVKFSDITGDYLITADGKDFNLSRKQKFSDIILGDQHFGSFEVNLAYNKLDANSTVNVVKELYALLLKQAQPSSLSLYSSNFAIITLNATNILKHDSSIQIGPIRSSLNGQEANLIANVTFNPISKVMLDQHLTEAEKILRTIKSASISVNYSPEWLFEMAKSAVNFMFYYDKKPPLTDNNIKELRDYLQKITDLLVKNKVFTLTDNQLSFNLSSQGGTSLADMEGLKLNDEPTKPLETMRDELRSRFETIELEMPETPTIIE